MLSSTILSFIVNLAIGLISIIYIQTVHGSSINFGNRSALQSPERTATLIVIKNVTYPPFNETDPKTIEIRSFFSANDFIIHMNGNNPSPFEFAGSESGTYVSIGQGPYTVTKTKPLLPSPFQGLTREFQAMAFSANYSKYCTGTIKDQEIKTCEIIDTLY